MPEYHSLKVTACCCMSDLIGLEVWRECCYAASLQVRKEKKKVTCFPSKCLWILFLLRRLLAIAFHAYPLYRTTDSKAFEIHWWSNVLLSHSTFYSRHPRLRLNYTHPKIYVREQGTSWERTCTKDIVIQSFVSRMVSLDQRKRVRALS